MKAMMPYWSEEFGNPGSLHSFGQVALAAVDKARESVAKSINADFREIVFTGSATEANNLALRGALKAARLISRGTDRLFAPATKSGLDSRRDDTRSARGQARRGSETFRSKIAEPPKIIISGIEHESILDTARDLEKDGVDVVYVPVDEKGIVDVQKIKEELDERTALVSVMYVNNEIGSVQPISEISKLVRNFGGRALLHTDAVQALNYFDCDVDKLGVDLMTLSGQKIYGPKGIGALYVRKSGQENLKPIITGGGQEFGLRSGTENVPAIVGFGKAVELAVGGRSRSTKEVKALKDYFWHGLKKFYPRAEVNGDSKAPHILNVYFPTEYAGDFLIKLDIAGVAASAGSACSARSYVPSPVLQALGLSQERVRGSLRFSFGKTLGIDDIKWALKQIEGILR
ncbi:cysteine desulfurase [bacterium]|nr:MAG: cysteine desulfurase [bacterium]